MSIDKFEEGFENNEFKIQDLFARYIAFWPLFLVLIVTFVGISLLYLRYTIPVFETSAKILIKDENKGLTESELLESIDVFGSKKIVENEIEILKSVDLLSQVVLNLNLYTEIYARNGIFHAPAYTISPIQIEVKEPLKLIEVEQMYFAYDYDRRQVFFDSSNYPLNEWVFTNFGYLKFSANPYYEETGSTFFNSKTNLYFSLKPVSKVAHELLKSVQVESASKQASIIYVRLRDAVPKRAENIINELISVYNQAAIDDKNSLGTNTLSFVNERLNYVVFELDSIEVLIQKYKNLNNIVDMSEQGRLFLESAEKNNIEVSKGEVELSVLEEVQKYVQGEEGNNAIVPSSLGVSDPVLATLLDKYYSAEIQYEGLRKTTAANNPLLLSLTDQMNALRPKILESINARKQNLRVGLNTMSHERDKYASILSSIPQKERQLLQISRQQSIKNSIYTFLLQKREETGLSLASTVADSRIIDKSHTSLTPVSPRKNMVLFIGVALAISIGVVVIGLREVINPNVMFREDLESLTTVPILGEVAYLKSHDKILHEGQRTIYAEQFRQLRTSLSYLGISGKRKKILVTSSISGEGKSLISANLAITLSFTGKKVALLELDLRRPQLSSIFKKKSEIGLTNYFVSDIIEDEIILETDYPNLYLIPSGPIPPNPTELILNGKINNLLDYLSQNFDYIVFDSAPINPVTDSYILSPLCDATLFIVRHNQTPKAMIRRMLSNKVTPLKNLAIVFNGVKKRRLGTYGYQAGYGYADESGYAAKKQGRKVKGGIYTQS